MGGWAEAEKWVAGLRQRDEWPRDWWLIQCDGWLRQRWVAVPRQRDGRLRYRDEWLRQRDGRLCRGSVMGG